MGYTSGMSKKRIHPPKMYIPKDLRQQIRDLSQLRGGVSMVVCLRHAVALELERWALPKTRAAAIERSER